MTDKQRGIRRIIVTHEFMARILRGENPHPTVDDGAELSSNLPKDTVIADILKLDGDHLAGRQFTIICNSSAWSDATESEWPEIFKPEYTVVRIADPDDPHGDDD